MAPVDPLFGIHAESLRLRSRQLDVIASNLANADTPNYKARDVDFQSTLDRALEQAAHKSPTAASLNELVYRTPLQPSLDGNTVDVSTEQAAFAKSAIGYQASLTFIESRMRGLMTAITGQ